MTGAGSAIASSADLFRLWGAGVRADDLWIIATAAACSAGCGVLGCFLILRRLSLLGDAISHAVLPGLAAAFILTSSRDPLVMLCGALAAGLLTAGSTEALTRWARLPEDASLGVVFSTLFAAGVLMITWVARDVDLDPGCVLYGLLEFVPLHTVSFLGISVPRSTLWLTIMLVINAGLIALCFKELKAASFDPGLARALGLPVGVIHGVLMALVAGTAVASFEAVGSILVVAMLVAPGATAHLLTDRLGRMIVLAGVLGVTAAILGYIGARIVDTSVAGMVSVAAGGQFLAAAALAPRHGLLSQALRRAALSLRIAREDLLSDLYRAHERAGANPAPATLRAPSLPPLPWRTRLAAWSLRRAGLAIRSGSGALALTERGVAAGAVIIRSHRLWESYLRQSLALPLDHLHEPSHRVEHYLGPALQRELEHEVGLTNDPHGRPIPGIGPAPRPSEPDRVPPSAPTKRP